MNNREEIAQLLTVINNRLEMWGHSQRLFISYAYGKNLVCRINQETGFTREISAREGDERTKRFLEAFAEALDLWPERMRRDWPEPDVIFSDNDPEPAIKEKLAEALDSAPLGRVVQVSDPWANMTVVVLSDGRYSYTIESERGFRNAWRTGHLRTVEREYLFFRSVRRKEDLASTTT